MKTLPIYQVDAFTDRLFAGNPAAVVPLADWLPDETMLAIAAENNLSETAFLVPAGEATWELRWFTPAIEVPLCGHATLATAFVLAEVLKETAETLTFSTRMVGDLTVTRDAEGWFVMRFPRRARGDAAIAIEPVAAALGRRPDEVVEFATPGDTSWLAVYADEADVMGLTPDFGAIAGLPPLNVIATAPGLSVDFVSRMFAPKAGIDEDPVTGAAHAVMVPYWAERLGRDRFTAFQASARGGRLDVAFRGDRVVLGGTCVTVIEGAFLLP